MKQVPKNAKPWDMSHVLEIPCSFLWNGFATGLSSPMVSCCDKGANHQGACEVVMPRTLLDDPGGFWWLRTGADEPGPPFQVPLNSFYSHAYICAISCTAVAFHTPRVYAHIAQEAPAQGLPYPREGVRSSVVALTYSYFVGFSGNHRKPPTPSVLLKSHWHPLSTNCPHQNWALGSYRFPEQKMGESPTFSATSRFPVAWHWTVRKAEEKVGIFSLFLPSSCLIFWPLLRTTHVWDVDLPVPSAAGSY